MDVVAPLGRQYPVDTLGHHVPGRQLGQLVLPHHEPFAVPVDQVRALTPQRLGDQRLLRRGRFTGRPGRDDERGGVELHELDVGDGRPGPQGQRHPVPGGDRRVGGGGEDLPHPAGGQDHRPGQDRTYPILGSLTEHVQGDPAGPTGWTGRVTGVGPQQVQYQRVLDQPDPRVPSDRGVQRPLHLRTRRVAAGVDDPVGPVAPLPGQHQRPVRVAVELGAGPDQLPQAGRSLLDQYADRVRVTEADPGDLRVESVRGRGVERIQHRGDAALRPTRGALVDVDLGDDGDVESRLSEVQRGGQPRDTRPDHQDVGGFHPTRGRRGEKCREHRQVRRVELHQDSQPRRSFRYAAGGRRCGSFGAEAARIGPAACRGLNRCAAADPSPPRP
jgi:hypothetical protein